MSLTGNYRINATLTNTKDNVDLSTPLERVSQSLSKTISTGVLYHDTVSLSASQITTLDFNDSSLNDVYGNSVEISGITGLYLATPTTNTVDVTVSGGVNAFLNDQPPLGAGEGLAFLTNIDITTNSKLYLINGAASSSINVIVTGDE